MWVKSSYCGASNTCAEVKTWRKSRSCDANTGCVAMCGATSGCVETAIQDTPYVEIRDSKFPDMPHIFLSKKDFGLLLDGIKNG